MVFGTIALQSLYWIRYRYVPVPSMAGHVFLGHVCRFLGRVSFFFSSALFSSVFFRHIPELDPLPDVAEAIVRVCLTLIVMFAFYCYSLELERFGVSKEVGTSHPD